VSFTVRHPLLEATIIRYLFKEHSNNYVVALSLVSFVMLMLKRWQAYYDPVMQYSLLLILVFSKRKRFYFCMIFKWYFLYSTFGTCDYSAEWCIALRGMSCHRRKTSAPSTMIADRFVHQILQLKNIDAQFDHRRTGLCCAPGCWAVTQRTIY